jgi:hypothetical protein
MSNAPFWHFYAIHLLCFGLCARGRLAFVYPEWGEVLEPSITVVIDHEDFECGAPVCLFHLALNQEVVYSAHLQHNTISIMLKVGPGHHQLDLHTSTPPGNDGHSDTAAGARVLADTVMFIVRSDQPVQDLQSDATSHLLACPQLNYSALSPSVVLPCKVLQRGGDCRAVSGLCDQWRHDLSVLHRRVDARMGSLNTSDSEFWFGIDSCIYSVLMMAAHAIASSHSALAPRAFDLALIAATCARACPGALDSGEWINADDHDVSAYWHHHSVQSETVFFIVVSGTAFMRHRARAVRCSWAARARNVIIISGKHEKFVDRCSESADADFPPWHALHTALAVPPPPLRNLTSRSLAHDDFFSSVPKFLLSLLLAWQLNPSAAWYYMAGCDTAVHPAALATLLKRLDPSRRLLVGGHVGVTRLLQSQLFLSGGAGLALSRAAVVSLIPVIEDFTETWLQQEGAACRCIPCADVALQRLCERQGIEMVELEGFYAFPPSHYMGSSVLRPNFAREFPWAQRLPQCRDSLSLHVENQGFQDMVQSVDGRWGRSRSMTSPPVAFHYLGPRRMHQSWQLLQSLHILHSKGLC